MRRLLAALALVVGLLVAVPAPAAEVAGERVQVADPYLELRTGAGRGYPVFYVAARNEWVRIELRHTDWYKVLTDNGKVGWVARSQLEGTLTEAGVAKSFRDLAVDDYLARRLDVGAAWGLFDSEPMLKMWGSYRLSDTLGAEATIGQVQGTYAGANFWQINLLAEPWSDQRFSPFAGIGFGRFDNFPNLSLVSAEPSSANLANAVIGARYHLGARFVVRADYSLYTVFQSERRTNEYSAFTVGLAFFF